VVVCGLLGACTRTVPVATVPPAVVDRQETATLEAQPLNAVPRHRSPGIDRSGGAIAGKASYYGSGFDGKKMANGEHLDPSENVAASKTLPLGTTAKVIDRDTGKSATVRITDRGPHVGGRVIDVSPSVASQLDMKKKGVARVEVKPITVPQADGTVKSVAGLAQ
jgi:rare lipoprotein A